ncbi:hypothetical protein J6590_027232 [Homalodisca vitripennis]|nr:hypothetical protein J6590_027232 [Homalodisca vitripennis]
MSSLVKGKYQKYGALVTTPFRKWKDVIGKFNSHSNSSITNFLFDSGRVEGTKVILDSTDKKEKEQNRASLKDIIDTTIFCGENEIPLREHWATGDRKPFRKGGQFSSVARVQIKLTVTLRRHVTAPYRNTVIRLHYPKGRAQKYRLILYDLNERTIIFLTTVKGTEINALLATVPELLVTLGESDRINVESKAESLHTQWTTLRQVLERRTELSALYVKFHSLIVELATHIDSVTEKLSRQPPPSQSERNQLEQEYSTITQLYTQLGAVADNFTQDSYQCKENINVESWADEAAAEAGNVRREMYKTCAKCVSVTPITLARPVYWQLAEYQWFTVLP